MPSVHALSGFREAASAASAWSAPTACTWGAYAAGDTWGATATATWCSISCSWVWTPTSPHKSLCFSILPTVKPTADAHWHAVTAWFRDAGTTLATAALSIPVVLASGNRPTVIRGLRSSQQLWWFRSHGRLHAPAGDAVPPGRASTFTNGRTAHAAAVAHADLEGSVLAAPGDASTASGYRTIQEPPHLARTGISFGHVSHARATGGSTAARACGSAGIQGCVLADTGCRFGATVPCNLAASVAGAAATKVAVAAEGDR
mmetsp:Transcript_126935/g.253740  ORF Transcript_126935/g.253740 Transcript_126935/m.253740 type:complete len:260 (+) Transcript_126935:462-1241(+)